MYFQVTYYFDYIPNHMNIDIWTNMYIPTNHNKFALKCLLLGHIDKLSLLFRSCLYVRIRNQRVITSCVTSKHGATYVNISANFWPFISLLIEHSQHINVLHGMQSISTCTWMQSYLDLGQFALDLSCLLHCFIR